MHLKHHTTSGIRTFVVDELAADALLAGFTIPSWQRDSACAEHVDIADAWFPERGQPTSVARAICAGCLVRAECLEFALEHDIDVGIWGGTSGRERRRLRSGDSAGISSAR